MMRMDLDDMLFPNASGRPGIESRWIHPDVLTSIQRQSADARWNSAPRHLTAVAERISIPTSTTPPNRTIAPHFEPVIDTAPPAPKVPAVTRIYDLAMTHKLDADDFFIQHIQRHCAEAGLNFFLVEPLWVHAFHEHLEQGRVWPRVLLNMHSEHHQPDDIFSRLLVLAAARGTQVIDPPDRARAAFDKARLHPQLVTGGVNVPWTRVVPRNRPADWKLDASERTALGSPFIIKPAMGYGRKGLVLAATSEADLDRSIAAWPDENYLFQRRVIPAERDGEPVYFRAYFVFGTVYLAWWNPHNDRYRLVTDSDRASLDLPAVEDISRQIAALTGMNFFSSEVAQDQDGRFVVIDYVNDQCHLLSQSASPALGVPDELVAAIAQRLVEATLSLIRAGTGQ